MKDKAKTARAEADVQEKLKALQGALSAAEKNPLFTTEYGKLPAERPHGKTFGYFIFNDLLKAFSYATNLMAFNDIPEAPYKMLLEARDNKPTSPDAARQYIMRQHQNQAYDNLPAAGPEFVGIFTGHLQQASMEVMLNIMPHWKAAAASLSACIDTEGDLFVDTRMNRYLEHMTALFNQVLDPKARNMTDDKKNDTGQFNSLELNELMERARSLGLPGAVLKRFESDCRRMDGMQENSQDYRSRLQPLLVMLDLPWNNRAKPPYSLKEIKARLDERHTGLDEVKDRIIEYLAVELRTGKPNGNFLCLDGAPGIGKTSLAQTVAYATGRPLVRISLGGVYDPSEIRGGSSRYTGAHAGLIMNAMIKVGVKNPIFQLDEIDKVSTQGGNKAAESALLAVLDPEQNANFCDAFLEVDFDLSEVTFIATSNDKREIMPALLNRMDVIDLRAYTAPKKLEIAQNHLLPRQMEKNGVNGNNFAISTSVIETLIGHHVREPGVRELERLIARLCRKAAYRLEIGQAESVFITDKNMYEFLDRPRHQSNVLTRRDSVGIVNGLAVAGHVGMILPFEVIKMPSASGKFTVKATGLMKDAMRESTSVIESWIRANAARYDISQEELDKTELHIDAVTDGPKDGPSAGAAMLTGCMSALKNTPIRADVAMTGKLSLSGRVLRIGGTIAKLEGAMREGMTTVLIPEENAADLTAICDEIRQRLDVVRVRTIDDVLREAFAKPALPAALQIGCSSQVANDTHPAPAEPPSQSPAMSQGLLPPVPKVL